MSDESKKSFEMTAITANPRPFINGGNAIFLYPFTGITNLTKYWSPGVYRHNGGIIYQINYPIGWADFVYNAPDCEYPALRAVDVGSGGYSILQFNYLSGSFTQFYTLEFWVYFIFDENSNINHPILDFVGLENELIDDPEFISLYLENDSWTLFPYSKSVNDPTDYVTSGTSTLVQKWVHVAFSFTGTYVMFFLDGKLQFQMQKNLFDNVLNNIYFYLWGSPGSAITYFTNIRLSDWVRYTEDFTIQFPSKIYTFLENEQINIEKLKKLPTSGDGGSGSGGGSGGSGSGGGGSHDIDMPAISKNPVTVFLFPVADGPNFTYGYDNKDVLNCYNTINTEIKTMSHPGSSDSTWIDFIQTEDGGTIEYPDKYVSGSIQFNINDNLAMYEGFDKFTIEMSFYTNFNDVNSHNILTIGGRTNTTPYLNFMVGNSDYQLLITNPLTNKEYANSDPTFIFRNRWSHVAIVYDKNSYFLLFVDGKLKYQNYSDEIKLTPYRILACTYGRNLNTVKITNFRFSIGILYNATFSEAVWTKKFTSKYSFSDDE